MKPRLFGLAFTALLLLALGLSAAACGGGGGGELSLQEYFQRLGSSFKDADQRSEALQDEFPAAFQEIEATQAALNGFGEILTDTLSKLDDLNPPREVKAAHDELLAAGADFAGIFQDFTDRVAELDSLSEFEELASEFLAEDAEFAAADERFTDACLALQGIADQNNIAVDLNCEGESA